MNDIEKNQLAALTRARDFGAQHSILFPAAKLSGQLLAIITAAVNELNQLTTTQETSTSQSRHGSADKSTTRIMLRNALEMINRAAHAMALDTPAIIEKFRIPHGSDHNLLVAARAFAVEALPLKDEFIRFGMPEDFLDDLDADILAFEQATAARNQSVEDRTASVAAIDEALARAMKALKQLDHILQITLNNNIQLLTAWMTASHIERVPHRRKPASAPPPASPPAQ